MVEYSRLSNGISIPSESREPVRYLVFSASLRAGSLNSQLANLAAVLISQHVVVVDLAKMADLSVPSYDQESDGFPAGAIEFLGEQPERETARAE